MAHDPELNGKFSVHVHLHILQLAAVGAKQRAIVRKLNTG